MKPRTTLIIAAIFLLLGGYVYFFELNKTSEQLSQQLGTPTAKPLQYVIQVNPQNVQGIEVSDLRAPRQVQLTRGASIWQITKPESKPAEQFQVESTLAMLANLRATRELTNVVDLGQYGFITPTLEARLTMNDGKQYAITIGNKTPNGQAYYAVYTGAKSPVYLIEASAVDALKEWLDAPPYEPTPTPTLVPTATPSAIATPAVTETPKP